MTPSPALPRSPPTTRTAPTGAASRNLPSHGSTVIGVADTPFPPHPPTRRGPSARGHRQPYGCSPHFVWPPPTSLIGSLRRTSPSPWGHFRGEAQSCSPIGTKTATKPRSHPRLEVRADVLPPRPHPVDTGSRSAYSRVLGGRVPTGGCLGGCPARPASRTNWKGLQQRVRAVWPRRHTPPPPPPPCTPVSCFFHCLSHPHTAYKYPVAPAPHGRTRRPSRTDREWPGKAHRPGRLL